MPETAAPVSPALVASTTMRSGTRACVGLAKDRSDGTSMPISARPSRTALAAPPGFSGAPVMAIPGMRSIARATRPAPAAVGAAMATPMRGGTGRIA